MSPSDTGTHAATRILVICNLDQRLQYERELMHSLNSGFEMGRFAHHIESAARLLPQLTAEVSIEPGELRFTEQPRVRMSRIAAAIAITPRDDGLLILDFDLAGDPAADEVAEFLYATWRGRFEMRVGEVPLLGWLAAQLGHVKAKAKADDREPLAFGQNVHQCVFAGGRLARRLLRQNRKVGHVSPDVITVIFRGTITARRGSHLGVRRPTALNNPGETMVAHGRGVSVIVGWSTPVENAFGVAAAGLVSAAGVVSQVRLRSLEALQLNDDAAPRSPSEVSGLIEGLAEIVNQLRADLSFGIEAYADVVLIPELLIESYHSSLRQVAGLADSLANTSRIVERVAAVISSRHAALDASVKAYSESRAKVFAGVVAFLTLLALPATVLLAYFGTNSTQVNSNWSIFDMHHYRTVYLVVWIPFILLVIGATVMRRLIRPEMPDWAKASPEEALRGPAPRGQEQPVVVPRRVDAVDPPR